MIAPRPKPAPDAVEAGAKMRVLKKYPNRRLYDTQTSSYITLADVKKMVLTGQEFVVRDAKSAEDLTRSILLQIILEEESGGGPMFTTSMLAQIIRFYGHAMQGMMGSYLEKNLQTLSEVQARVAENSKGLYDPRKMNPELWAKFMSGQAPVVHDMMGTYVEQSRAMFEKMQDQMTEQTKALFPGMPGFPPNQR